jgi:hypothetical protein
MDTAMFCSWCGVDTGNDSPFCTKCGGRSIGAASTPTTGGAAAAVAPALYRDSQSKRKEPETDLAVWVLLPILLVGVWFTVTCVKQLQRLSTTSRDQIANTPVTVAADRYYYYAFKVPQGARDAVVQGRFSTVGGTGNEIEAYILRKDDFDSWWNGKQSPTLYQSGKVTRGAINARLPADGVYYLVLNNQVSQASSKVVQIDVTLTYNP